MKIGGASLTGGYIGESSIVRIYLGADIVFPAEAPSPSPPPTISFGADNVSSDVEILQSVYNSVAIEDSILHGLI